MIAALLVALALAARLPAAAAAPAAAYEAVLAAANFTGNARVTHGPGTTVWRQSFGYRSRKYRVPMDKDARFPVASNTKLYVAISLYQLQEQGKVVLSRPVADYLPPSALAALGFPPQVTRWCPVVAGSPATACRNVTFQQLLGMSAGLPDLGFQFRPYPGSLAAVVGWHLTAPNGQLLFEPGTQYYYSNPSFMLGAYMVELLSGQPFGDYLRANIMDPLGLSRHTYYDPYNGKLGGDDGRVDEFYRWLDPATKAEVAWGPCSSEFDLGSANGAGGIVSTQVDEATLYYTLFNFSAPMARWGRPVLRDPASVVSIVAPWTPMPGSGNYYAQGLFIWSPNASAPVPPRIMYEGEIMCSLTANYFDTTATPHVLTQVWSNTHVRFVSSAALAAQQASERGSFFSFLQSLPGAPGGGLMGLATALHNLYMQ